MADLQQLEEQIVGLSLLDAAQLVKRLEERTSKRWVKMMLRSGLNPSRSMANAMRLEVPWHRDTRPGIFGNSNAPLLAASHPLPIKYMDSAVPRGSLSALNFSNAAVSRRPIWNMGYGRLRSLSMANTCPIAL